MTDGGNDLDALMKAHQAAQEKVAEDMLSLTGLLKEQAIAAGEIVRKDTAVSTHSIVSHYPGARGLTPKARIPQLP